MNSTFIQMTEDEFDNQYPLIPNHLNPNASWGYGDSPGSLFETYGEELAFVQTQAPSTVWTLLDGEDDDQYLASGFHFVNRIGYLISSVPVPPDVEFEVRIPMSDALQTEDNGAAKTPIADEARLSEIAREHLGIPTLEARQSDSLDFHDVSVWAVHGALTAAFNAGRQSASPPVPQWLEALRLAQRALNTAPRFRVGDTDSYKIAAMVDEAIEIATERREP